MGETQRRRITLPLPNQSEWGTLELPVPLTEDQWVYLMELLALMKPGLARPAPVQGQREEGPGNE